METQNVSGEAEQPGEPAPKITFEMINAQIHSVHYISGDKIYGPNGIDPLAQQGEELGVNTLTICMVILKNGYKIIGTSVPVAAANYDDKLGRKYAFDRAIEQIWLLLGYELKSRLHQNQKDLETVRREFTRDNSEGMHV